MDMSDADIAREMNLVYECFEQIVKNRKKVTPTIILKGQWLKEMGFEIGDYITVSCEDGKLVITPDAEKAAMAKAEAEFMEKGMKKLQKRFQAEKEQLHAQFVAERSTEYNGREVQ